MLTDLALILFPIHVIYTLQMSMAKKMTILTFFGARSLYVCSFRPCVSVNSYGTGI
jgi:hypothetical protein